MPDEPVKILLRLDNDCDMEALYVNGACMGFGNSCDDHCQDRFKAIKETLDLLGIKYEAEVDQSWRYGEDE